MTENQWPEDPATTAPPASTGIPGERSAATFPSAATPQYGAVQPGDSSGTSRKDAAKEEAADVARTAKGSAQNVAQTAKEEAAHVASEAKYSAQELLHQAKSGLTSQAGTQQQKAAEGMRNISSQLHSMATAPDQQGVASDLVRQAAERTSATTPAPSSCLQRVQASWQAGSPAASPPGHRNLHPPAAPQAPRACTPERHTATGTQSPTCRRAARFLRLRCSFPGRPPQRQDTTAARQAAATPTPRVPPVPWTARSWSKNRGPETGSPVIRWATATWPTIPWQAIPSPGTVPGMASLAGCDE